MRNMSVFKKKAAGISAALVGIILVFVIVLDCMRPSVREVTDIVMGSPLSISAVGCRESTLKGAILAARQDELLLSCRIGTSEISLLNKEKNRSLSERTLDVIRACLELCDRSEGAFDIRIGEISELWDFQSAEPALPDAEELARRVERLKTAELELDKDSVRIKRCALDLGAVGKGLACERIIEELKKNNARGAVVSVGGSIGFFGKNSKGREGFSIGIRKPSRDSDEIFARLSLKEGYASTSGNYEKSFIIDSVLYHHILSPRTGYPVESQFKSVTVLAQDGLLSDALSTACFALDYQKALSLLEHYSAEAVFVDNANKVFVTEGLKGSFELLDGDFSYDG